MQNLDYLASKVRRYNIPSEIQISKERELIKAMEDQYQTVETIFASGILPAGAEIDILSMMYYKGLICFSNLTDAIISAKTEVYING